LALKCMVGMIRYVENALDVFCGVDATISRNPRKVVQKKRYVFKTLADQ
jgi:hypothetical protein